MTDLAAEYRRRGAADHDIRAQMPVLYAWAHSARAIIELGVRGGNSTCAFLAGLERGAACRPDAAKRDMFAGLTAQPELAEQGFEDVAALARILASQPGSLWSVDIAEPEVPAAWRELASWHLLVADDLSPEAVAFCPDGADVLFIDTSHAYAHTLSELRAYAPKVRPGGVILLHDTDPAEWPGVSQAIGGYCRETGRDWYDHPFWHGLGVIEIPC